VGAPALPAGGRPRRSSIGQRIGGGHVPTIAGARPENRGSISSGVRSWSWSSH
jgi:hypothetical protein